MEKEDLISYFFNTIDYWELVRELKSREMIGQRQLASLREIDTSVLLLIKKSLERSELDPEKVIEKFENRNNLGRAWSLSKLISAIGKDNRKEIWKLTKESLKRLAIKSTVLVVPDNDDFGAITETNFEPVLRSFANRFGRDLNSDQLFVGEKIFDSGTRSGVILKDSDPLKPQWVVTAGHGLSQNQSVVVISNYFRPDEKLDDLEIPVASVSKGEVIHLERGSPNELDFAVIRLAKHIQDVGIDVDTSTGLSIGKPLFTSGHALGMPMIADEEGAYLDRMFDHWGNRNYFFADLDVNTGSSGGPVFEYVEATGDIGAKLVGIVVGSGGTKDFTVDGNKLLWYGASDTEVVGTRVLKWENIVLPVKLVMKFPGTIPDLPERPRVVETQIGLAISSVNLISHRVFVENESIVIIEKDSPENITLKKIIPNTLLLLNGNVLTITQGADTLEGKYNNSLLVSYHYELWPMDSIVDRRHRLEFLFQAGKAELGLEGFPADHRYNVLDGIGAVDIVDELPNAETSKRRMTWFCNGEYVELSILKHGNGSPLGDPSILIRTAKPFVSIFTRSQIPK